MNFSKPGHTTRACVSTTTSLRYHWHQPCCYFRRKDLRCLPWPRSLCALRQHEVTIWIALHIRFIRLRWGVRAYFSHTVDIGRSSDEHAMSGIPNRSREKADVTRVKRLKSQDLRGVLSTIIPIRGGMPLLSLVLSSSPARGGMPSQSLEGAALTTSFMIG